MHKIAFTLVALLLMAMSASAEEPPITSTVHGCNIDGYQPSGDFCTAKELEDAKDFLTNPNWVFTCPFGTGKETPPACVAAMYLAIEAIKIDPASDDISAYNRAGAQIFAFEANHQKFRATYRSRVDDENSDDILVAQKRVWYQLVTEKKLKFRQWEQRLFPSLLGRNASPTEVQ